MLSKISERDLVAWGSGFPVSALTAHQPAPHQAGTLEMQGPLERPGSQRERSNVPEAHRQSGGPRRSPAGKAVSLNPEPTGSPQTILVGWSQLLLPAGDWVGGEGTCATWQTQLAMTGRANPK